jgi:hypothetical protein
MSMPKKDNIIFLPFFAAAGDRAYQKYSNIVI